ncbi:unnamed protein product [Vitrella brassicaformis CCMP3155]|uniref:Uncharacterized protein n=1 Tax=Vitrella brassicaformis (strain CCMP3155) TaxID=1169540 RepID=A0A0G4EVL1_VITBC|nr:unnamed protein product [Vitrella brassicaformis CCMP3155]|eukprot:CEM02324.1 unnamed protein product [Vitrella brassicaformis CCMP3155]
MAWTTQTQLPFFVLILGGHAVVVHPLYHSKDIDRNSNEPFPHSKWMEKVNEIIEAAVRKVPRETDAEGGSSSSSSSKKSNPM